MKTFVRWLVLLGFLCPGVLTAQEAAPLDRVSQIRAAPSRYINERVRLQGYVTQFVELGSQTTSFFYLKDDWGGIIKVRTSKDRPSVGKRYEIEGPVSIDPRTKDLYISEESRVEKFKANEATVTMEQGTMVSPPKPAEDTGSAATGTQDKPLAKSDGRKSNEAAVIDPQQGLKTQRSLATYAMLGGGAALVLALAGVMLFRGRNQEVQTGDFSLASAMRVETPPAPEQVIEGRTIKLHAPPPNTVKMLPGWFEVLSGDDVVKQIRFYRVGGDQGNETTFGRAAGRPYVHIQLKASTVSSRQAKVSFEGATAKLTNFASSDSNPTRVNSRELGVNETVALQENDRVEMGEVNLAFHYSATAQTIVT